MNTKLSLENNVIVKLEKFLYNSRLTCVYAACKIEENHVSAEELGKGISQDHQMILNYEMIVSQVWLLFSFLFLLVLLFSFACASQKYITGFAESGI